jgi:hypothetical protein
MNKTQIRAIESLVNKLSWMIQNLAEYYDGDLYEKSLKVRPGYGYDKFYLDFITGSYDMSLQSLINFMLQDNGYYKRLLSKETYNKIKAFNKRNPETLFDFKNEDEYELIKNIEYYVICLVAKILDKYNYDIKEFKEEGYVIESIIPHISKDNLMGDYIHYFGYFNADLNKYIESNTLTKDDQESILEIFAHEYTDPSMTFETFKILYLKYPLLVKDLILQEKNKCKKKSECSKLIISIKETINDAELIENILDYKNKL